MWVEEEEAWVEEEEEAWVEEEEEAWVEEEAPPGLPDIHGLPVEINEIDRKNNEDAI